jgi:GNAT superfamily N-acetyltransferase
MSHALTGDIDVALFGVTVNDVQPIEHFADAVLRDDFFFRKGHWLSLVADSRVEVLAVRVKLPDVDEWSEICGLVVLYADSVLHNLFLSRQWRSIGLGSAIIEAVSPRTIRAKVDMKSGDPTGFYQKLGYTHEQARKGKRGQIKVLTKLTQPDVLDHSEHLRNVS